MDMNKINKYVDGIFNHMIFHMDYHNIKKTKNKLLLVEGTTDYEFIDNVLNTDVVCIQANKTFCKDYGVNYKNVIVNVINGISKIPMLIRCKESQEWSVFGMIDLDFDKSDDYDSMQKIFVTDTHDLETLLMSTDAEILERIRKCKIEENDIKIAFNLAYQIGILKNVIYNVSNGEMNGSKLSNIEIGTKYEFLNDSYEISVREAIEYINNHEEGKKMSSSKVKKIVDKLVKDKSIKKYLDEKGRWNIKWSDFNVNEYADFWQVTNGHDILSILRYVNEGAAMAYSNSAKFTLNREFEMDLIANYEYSKLVGTSIYENMLMQDVVKNVTK